MEKVKRYPNNPFLGPDRSESWQGRAVFNGCPIKDGDTHHIVYRALSHPQIHRGAHMSLSTIGYAKSEEGLIYTDRKLLIEPEYDWEAFGCEDPRVTKLDDTYYILYTALSDFPHTPAGIKVAVAVTDDFKTIKEKHQVTNFNSKAFALFPEKVNGKYTAILSANTDTPPVQIAIAQFDSIEQMWSPEYWDKWLPNIDNYTVHLQRNLKDHIEVGAPPVKTEFGWLLVYCYIKNYKTNNPVFGVELAMLDSDDPSQVVGRITEPLLVPQEHYELYGDVPNVIFPSGAIIQDEMLYIYYGAADTSCCFAAVDLDCIYGKMGFIRKEQKVRCTKKHNHEEEVRLERFEGNPIIEPNPENEWESKYTLNPTAIYDDGKVHILYRAQNQNDTSVVGYAVSRDGLHIDEKYQAPIYVPREDFEIRLEPGNSGCEDARITRLGDMMYMCYTAYNGEDPAYVALTSISVQDFRERRWDQWKRPKIISPMDRYDKNSCVVSEKIQGKFAIFHRMDHKIWIDYVDDIEFKDEMPLQGKVLMEVREGKWDSEKVGIAGPPIRIDEGWLLIYHALSKHDGKYRLGAVLLDENCGEVLHRLDYPILEPEAEYENSGLRPGTVFSCGAVVLGKTLYVYYGGADQVVCVATVEFERLVTAVKNA